MLFDLRKLELLCYDADNKLIDTAYEKVGTLSSTFAHNCQLLIQSETLYICYGHLKLHMNLFMENFMLK